MQHLRTIRVQHAFRVTGGTRRITQRRGVLFVQLRPVVLVRLVGDERLVAEDVLELGLRHRPLAGHDDECFYIRQIGRELLDQRENQQVNHDVLVIRMVNDECDLLRKQARVDCVAIVHYATALVAFRRGA